MTSSEEGRSLLAQSPEPEGSMDGKKHDFEMRAIKSASTSHLDVVAGRRDFDTISRVSTLRSGRSVLTYSHYHVHYVDKVITAVKMGDLEKLGEVSRKLGTEGLSAIIREHDGKNNTALHYAAYSDNVEMVKFLISFGADVNEPGEGGKSPLHFAVLMNNNTFRQEVEHEHHDGKTRENSVSVLLGENADVNATDVKGMTPLHMAARQGNMDSFVALLSWPGITIDAQDNRGTTALCQACQSGKTDAALMLINKGADPLISDVNGDTPMHIAVRHSHSMIVMTLIEVAEGKSEINKLLMSQNSRGLIPLYDAVKCGNTELFQLCLNHVSEHEGSKGELQLDDLINFVGENNDTLLHVACSAGHTDIIQTLVSRGALLDPPNNDSQTPLHLACAQNHEQIALCLVEHGADSRALDNTGLNPLQVAANHNSFETLIGLFQSMSTVAGGHCDEATELVTWAATNNKPETLKKILNYEIKYHEISDEGIMDFIMDAVKNKHLGVVVVLLRWNRTVVDHMDKEENTPLHHAAVVGDEDIVQELIKAKARVNAKNSSEECERSALHYASASGWVGTARILLDGHADIDQMDNQNMTPLHHACMNGHVGMVEMLLYGKGAGEITKPADIMATDINGHNCLDHAIDNGQENIARLILGHERWRDVMCTSSYDEDTPYKTTPMRKLIRTMPAIARLVLDRCIILTGGKSPKDKNVAVGFYYELLEDEFSPWMKSEDVSEDLLNNNANGRVGGFLNRIYQRVSTSTPHEPEDDQYGPSGRLNKHAQSFITDSREREDNHPLRIMVVSQRVDLLDHPVVTTLLQHKWNTIGRYVFMMSLFIYMIFVALLTGYIIVIPPNYYVDHVNRTGDKLKVVWMTNGMERWVQSVSRSTLIFFDRIGPPAIVAMSVINLLRELMQLFLQRWSYFRSAENYLEWFLYITAILFALPFSEVEYVKYGNIKKEWQWRYGAIAGFFAWVNLLLFIRKNSKLGIYVIMFIDIIRTFLKFAPVLLFMLIAFALTFYALLMNQNPFNTLGASLAKTFVMMIGELDFGDIFFAQDYLGTSNTIETDGEDAYFMNTTFYRSMSFGVFSVFLVLMSILMMNMLVGLAVDDIQAIQLKAKLHRLAMQVDSVMNVQNKLPMRLWRSSVVQKRKFPLNDTKVKKWVQRMKSIRKQLKRAIENHNNQEDTLTQGSSIDEAYDQMSQRMKELSWKVERATIEMVEGTKKREDHFDHLRSTHKALRDRTDLLFTTQERLEDRMDLMHRKVDALLKRLKVKKTVGESFADLSHGATK